MPYPFRTLIPDRLPGSAGRNAPSRLVTRIDQIQPRTIPLALICWLAVFHVPALAQNNAAPPPATEAATAGDYSTKIRPLLQRYCFECHSGDLTEADIDLAEFKNLVDVRKRVKTWLKIREMLDSAQMPPPDSPQPDDDQRARLRSWVQAFLTAEAVARAGDPGPVVLRRLNNAEYNYTIRDLTGVSSLDPTHEFPVDGAAGEGFINTGSAQAMSPSLVTKYLDAAKQIARHAVVLPDGIRFSTFSTRRDHTDELLARIQAFYRRFTDEGGGATVNLQGIKFDTNQGGLLPVQRYLATTLEYREVLASGSQSVAEVAAKTGLNPRYLQTLWTALARDDAPTAESQSALLLNGFRQKWRRAGPADAGALAAEVARAQKTLWKFNTVGQLGDAAKPKVWMEAVSPLVPRQELRLGMPATPTAADIVVYLTAHDLGDGRDEDFVIWDEPRFVFKSSEAKPAHPPLLLRDVHGLVERIRRTMAQELPRTALYLSAVAALRAPDASLDAIAKSDNLNPRLLRQWAELAGLAHRGKREIRGQFTDRLTRAHGYEAVNGWGTSQTPNMLTNRSNENISFLTLTVPARGVVMHPSPTQESVVAWRSPLDGKIRLDGRVADADDVCGNGAAWRIELLTETGTTALTQGAYDNGGKQKFQLDEPFDVHKGDVISLIVNARDNSHACDTTHVELKIAEVGNPGRSWDLAKDVVDKILEANPLPDAYGHAATWHFCATGSKPKAGASEMVPGSTLASWRSAVLAGQSADAIGRLAEAVQQIATTTAADALPAPDRQLRDKLLDWRGPLRWTSTAAEAASGTPAGESGFGIAAESFGKHPAARSPVKATSLCLQAPHVLEVRLPAALVAGAELVVTGELHASTGNDGSVQLQLLDARPNPLEVSPSQPLLVRSGGAAEQRLAAATARFRDLFPAALCYARIVPVDEVVTMTLYFREDHHLRRLMLDDQQAATLDRLWDELFYVAREPIALTVAFEQIYEFATQDRPDLVKAFGPMRKPINARADVFRQRLLETEPAHLEAVLEFAHRAWRRPLRDSEQAALRQLYARLRSAELEHEAALRLTLARVLTSPAFLYRKEQPGPGREPAPVSSYELANRLSYFLWSSMPDSPLTQAAATGTLADDDELRNQVRRMLDDDRTRRLAIQFACQWLHLRDFDQNDDKNEKRYPEFAELRGDMYEETVRFFEDMFRHNGSILGLIDADHTFLNGPLARHYGIPAVADTGWQRVSGMRARGRGGVLGMASLLASQSGASRTSPILRGNWVYETLLGERLPRPPANVPQLPEAVPAGKTARELIEQHSSVAACAKCHARIDPYGFALEQFDAIGRLRQGAVDTSTRLIDGRQIEGLDGLRSYLLEARRDDLVRQFCRKLLGYALGREVQLSDEPLLAEMQQRLQHDDFRFATAVETIVLSRQFREIRGIDFVDDGS